MSVYEQAPIERKLLIGMVDDGQRYEEPVDVVMHPQALEGEGPLTLLFGGYGERLGTIRRGVAAYGRLGITAIAPILTFDHPEYIESTMAQAPLVVADFFNDESGRPAASPVNAIGKCLGGAVVIKSAASEPERYSQVALHSPAGLTNEMLGATREDKGNEFLRRLADNSLSVDQSLLFDFFGNLTALVEGESQMFNDMMRGHAASKAAFVLGLELGPDLRRLVASGCPVGIFAGRTDQVFTTDEYAEALGELNLQNILVEMSGSHTLFGSNACFRQQSVVASWLLRRRQMLATA